jgi:hypothetical protein
LGGNGANILQPVVIAGNKEKIDKHLKKLLILHTIDVLIDFVRQFQKEPFSYLFTNYTDESGILYNFIQYPVGMLAKQRI